MKIGRVLIVVGSVVLAHAVGFFFLVRSSGVSDVSDPDAGIQEVSPAISDSAVSLPSGTDSRGGLSTSESGIQEAATESSSSLSSREYSSFVYDPGDMSRSLEKTVNGECRSGILVDLSSRRILWKRNAETTYPIASMSKIMTAYELMCQLTEPGCKNTLETRVKVPRKMYRKFSDCHIYMDPRESFTIDELLKCMMIHSANDCAYLLAEHMAGSEAAFVAKMNARAKSLGYQSMSFCNSNGLPDRRRHRANSASAYDMARLAERVMDVPEIMKWAGTRKDAIREVPPARRFDLSNKNRLLARRECPGINGLKTGYIDASKFCITVTCERNKRRMVCVVMGADKASRRDKLVIKLVNWGYSIK